MGIVLDFLLDQGTSPALDILGSRAGPVPGHPNPDDELIKADTTNSTAHCCLCYHYVHSSGTFQFYLKKKKPHIQFFLQQQKCVSRGPVNKSFLSLEIRS